MYPEDILDKIQEIEKQTNLIKEENNKDEKYIKIKEMQNKMFDFLLKVSAIEGESESKVVNEVIELLQMLDNKHRFDNIFESDINYSLFFLYVKAVIYQKNWDLKNLSEILSKMEEIYKNNLDVDNSLFFVKENAEFPQYKKYFGFDQFRKIKYFTLYIETLLQHTAVLSQLNDHKGALNKANYCFKVYQKFFLSLNKIFELIVAVGHENLKNVDFDDDNFNIFLNYLELIKKFNFPTNGEKNKPWDSDCTYWKINKNNNDKYLIKKIESQSLLDFSKDKINLEWSYGFHISNIVKLVNFETFHLKLTNITFDKNLLVKVFLMFSCCIFSIAAENRFISHDEVVEEIKNSKNIEKKENLKNQQKYLEEVSKELKLQKHQRFIYSEKVHSKALEVLLFGFSTNIKLLKHFIQSYKKNYTFNILAIQEVDEPSISTMKKSEYFNDPFSKIPGNEEILDINKKLTKIADGMRDLKTLRYNRSGTSFNKLLNSKSPFRKNSNIIFNRLKINKKDLSPKFYKRLSQKLLTKTSFKKKNQVSSKKNENIFSNNSLKKKEKLLRKSKNEFNEILKKKNIRRNSCKSKDKLFKKFKKSISRSNNKKNSKNNFSSKLENLINQMNDRIQNFNNDIPNNLK